MTQVKDNTQVREMVRQIFTEYLVQKKCRKTPERFAILDMIYSLDGHFDIESLYTLMEETANFRVSRATLYNTLILLLDARLVVKHSFGNSSQYEKCYNQETHLHMICTQCGKVLELHDEKLQDDINGAKLKRFHQSHYSLYIYGVCDKCYRANKRKLINQKYKKKK